MRVILLQDVLHQGKRGDVIDVKPGYARNFLLPQGVALPANDGNLKYFEQLKRKIDVQHEEERAVAQKAAEELEGVRVTVLKRVDENQTLYGSVTATEISDALTAHGVEIDRRRIDLEGGIKSLGDHPVRIELHADVIAEITVTVDVEE
jgi:large subunit ribosomal protein L9